MDSLLHHVLPLLALFGLRCILPLAITLGAGWLLRRWVERTSGSSAKESDAIPRPADIEPKP